MEQSLLACSKFSTVNGPFDFLLFTFDFLPETAPEVLPTADC